MSEEPGAGDPRLTMRLLWRVAGRSRRGPKPTLDLDTIISCAIALADENGLSAVSMRSIAERLGRAMSLYTYLPGKAELLDLMHDHALGELPTDYSGTRELAGCSRGVDSGRLGALRATSVDGAGLDGPTHARTAHLRPTFEAQVAILDGTGLTGTEIRTGRRRHPGLHSRCGPRRRRHAAHGTSDRPLRRRVVGDRRAAAERAHWGRRLADSLSDADPAGGRGNLPAARPGA